MPYRPAPTVLLSALSALAVAAVSTLPASAQPFVSQNPRTTLALPRIDSAQAPTIDGDLSDPAWANAVVIDDFVQIEPVPGTPVSERTVVRIMYDENNFYFSVYAYDSEPENIILRSMARDSELYTGDNVGFTLDPGPTRRDAYSFQFSPSGGRNDSLILNNVTELEEWNPIWALRTRLVEDGWVGEAAIPFRSLSYAAGDGVWGFDVSRDIPRRNEETQWASLNPALEFTDVSQSGTLTGINNINRGVGLDIQVYGVARAKRDWHIPGEDLGISGTAGANLFYKITPALTGTLTFNPDFSDAPLDARQINTTRFSLFFPETRDFFLQDAGAFEFGGRGFARGGFGNDRDTNNGRPFFSRNIGLVDGEQVSIIAGGKLSGEYGGFGIGALSVLTEATPTTDRQILSAARITRPLLGESRAGIVITHGDPTGETDNTVVGADFQYRNSNFMEDKIFLADVFFLRSFSSDLGDDDSFGLSLAYPNEPWSWDVNFKQLGRYFEPALGFVNRTSMRLYEGNAAYSRRVRDSWMQAWTLSANNKFFTDLNNQLETSENGLSVDIETASDDEFGFEIGHAFEDVPEPFDVGDVLVLPAGRYNWTNFELEFESSEARSLSVRAFFQCCSIYNGDSVSFEVGFGYRPSAFFELSTDWEAQFIDVPTGSVDIHVLTSTAAINFTPDMSLALQAQWDNLSEDFGFLARYRWEFLPGSELFVAFGQAALVSRHRFDAQRSELSVRLGHTFRL